ncbi:MAG: ABC transporter substrate-binding protein [Burkholderiales bacterium]|jgi:peptide/nickel transport system substrate-binding protein|nr:ABC transporter substrate-binding protein [Burkholderiales bacterium]
MNGKSFIAALCAAAALFAAVPAPAAELRIGLSGEVTSLDPHLLASQPNLTVARHVFESLTDVDPQTKLIPGLAERWRALDALTWEFSLRRGVKFHDGSEFTAEDAAFSIARPLSIRGSPGGFASYVRAVESATAVDRHTLRVRTKYPYGALPEELNSILIVSRRHAQDAGPEDFDSGRAMVGTGPYRFVRYQRGDRLELARHDGWWGKAPAWNRVTLRVIPADPSRTAALLSGELDVIEHVPSADLKNIIKNNKLHVTQTTSWRTILLHLDQYRAQPPGVSGPDGRPLADNPFRDPRVRRAISMAINRSAIAERVMEGLAVPAANVVSPDVFGHNAALKPQPYDPEGAKRLLGEAGYPKGFRITLAGPNNRYINDEQILQTVAQLLTRIGLQTRVEAMPMSAFLGRVRKEETAVSLLGWGSFAADLALRSLVAAPNPEKGYGAWNWGRYANPKVDALMEQALASVDRGRREALAREANTLAMQDLAFIPLHHQVVSWAMRADLAYVARTDEFTFAHHFSPARR